jgi:uncharacterized protein YbaP (TraB family)
MSHRLRALLILAGLWLGLASVLQAAPDNSLLWRIEAAGQTASRPSYLLGTIHSEDPRVTRLPPAVARAFEQADSFSAELDMNMATLLKASQQMFADEGQGLKARLRPALYRRSAGLLALHGIPEPLSARMKIWAAAATLSTPPPQGGQFLDMQLYNQAVATGKRVYGLETIEEQVGALESMPARMQQTMLQDALDQHDQLAAIIEQLIRAYQANDLQRIVTISEQSMQQGDARVAERFNQEVVVKRNRRMVERMLPRLQEGKAFIAVGALHLPGEEGLVALLRARGYRVVAVEW